MKGSVGDCDAGGYFTSCNNSHSLQQDCIQKVFRAPETFLTTASPIHALNCTITYTILTRVHSQQILYLPRTRHENGSRSIRHDRPRSTKVLSRHVRHQRTSSGTGRAHCKPLKNSGHTVSTNETLRQQELEAAAAAEQKLITSKKSRGIMVC